LTISISKSGVDPEDPWM